MQLVVSEAEATLKEALLQTQLLHLPGVRDAFRHKLERVIELLDGLPEVAGDHGFDAIRARIERLLLEAHSLRAEDARYGAGQLARGSQRAPTEPACEDGWRRVESIVLTSEASALAAVRLASRLGDARARRLAVRAEAAAKTARQLVEQRNHAYTFHTDPAFSFGEGWYAAAAALLADIRIQLEPTAPEQLVPAERFLNEAGLASKLVAYASRPRANKALPAIVAAAFAADETGAQARLRASFLGQMPIFPEILSYAEPRLSALAGRQAILLWVRDGSHQKARNTESQELLTLCQMAIDSGMVPILVGDALGHIDLPGGAIDMTLFWKQRVFQEGNARRAQLQLFELMKSSYGLVGQLGVTSAGMDGPALMGLRTMYITDEPNVRLGLWVGSVPGYEEIVRDEGYLQRIRERLQQWRSKEAETQPTLSRA